MGMTDSQGIQTGREVGVGMTVLRVRDATGGKGEGPWTPSLGQGFEQVVTDVTVQGPEGLEGGGAGALVAGGLGWSEVCMTVVTRERHLWGARGFTSDLGALTWVQTEIG